MVLRPEFEMSPAAALDFLTNATCVHVAGTTPSGDVLLRTLDGVVVDGAVCFHGTPHGHKALLDGRPVVVSAERIVARIASYFVDPRFACPASTYYVSVMGRGVVETVDSLEERARILTALMQKLQPEGGYQAIDPEQPAYRNVLGGLWVARIRLESLVGKMKLGQHRSAEQMKRILVGLWQRGEPGDAEAMGELLAAHPAQPIPDFLKGPEGTVLFAALGDRDLPGAVALLRGQYWTEGVPDDAIARAQRGSVAWVGARQGLNGPLIATARANSDGSRHAYLADVAVHAEFRRRGIGSALVKFLLDHPRVRRVSRVRLGTRDARFYAPMGFTAAPPTDHRSLLLVRS